MCLIEKKKTDFNVNIIFGRIFTITQKMTTAVDVI